VYKIVEAPPLKIWEDKKHPKFGAI